MYLALLRQYSTWVLIGLGTALVISIVAFILAYRKAKQAPYFLWRQEAARRARRLFALILLLLLAGGGTIWVALSAPADPERLARQPVPSATPTTGGESAALPGPTTIATQPATPAPATTPSATPTPASTSTPTQTVAPAGTAAPSDTRPTLEFVAFARDVAGKNEPVGPATEFAATHGPIYAFFKYANLANGMEWTFIWQKDNVELTRENRYWEWGAYGQAYVFFEPPGGYDEGEYVFQIQIEEQLLIDETFSVK